MSSRCPVALKVPAALKAVVGMAVALAGFGAASGLSYAADLRMTVEKPHYTCERTGALLSHASYRPEGVTAAPTVLPCCDGQFSCAQFLSTRTVLHAARRWHS